MESIRLEILTGGVWRRLSISNSNAIKYNRVVNRIAELTDRRLSHSNTFSLPLVHTNIQALGINVFNHYSLSRALNSRYICKYYINEKVFQEGYLIINNTSFDEIRVNFIQTSLDLIEKWNDVTFKELLLNPNYIKPVDYQAAIDEMKNFTLSKTAVATYLSEVGTRGHNLSLFPNNLNTIGDIFQIDDTDFRQDNTFNPYQSRPIFNAKAIFDLATETFGYTPIYDDSVDWAKIENFYIVKEGLNESSEDNVSEVSYAPNNPQSPNISSGVVIRTGASTLYNVATGLESGRFLRPSDIPNWVDPFGYTISNYRNLYSLFVPDLENSPNGNIIVKVTGADTFSGTNPSPGSNTLFTAWTNSTPGGDVQFRAIGFNTGSYSYSDGIMTYSVDKVFASYPPANGDVFLGFLLGYGEATTSPTTSATKVEISETFLNLSIIAFDDFGQFTTEELDLTFAIPNEKLKDLIKGLMNLEGILLDINEKDKTVKFFNYSIYNKNKTEGNFSDWSMYLRKSTPFIYNTDYGNKYARTNNIGLKDPFPGNTFNIRINQSLSDLSKYKDYITNYSEIFADVSDIKKINNSITPYTEFTNLGLGLVEYVGNLGDLTQTKADRTTLGTLRNLPALANINYALLPQGIQAWYRLVSDAVRANPTFLLPQDVIKNIDLSEPIYLSEMNGFWIIEEISEYENKQTPVVVKLIRVVDEAEFNDDFNDDFKV